MTSLLDRGPSRPPPRPLSRLLLSWPTAALAIMPAICAYTARTSFPVRRYLTDYYSRFFSSNETRQSVGCPSCCLQQDLCFRTIIIAWKRQLVAVFMVRQTIPYLQESRGWSSKRLRQGCDEF